MANSIIGQIISIGQPLTLTSKSGQQFTKRSVIVSVRRFDPNTGEPVNDYENTPEFSFMNDRCRDLDQYQVGQNVCISFDVVGRKYIDNAGAEKIINDIRPYKIELYGAKTTATPQTTQVAQQPIAAPQASTQQYYGAQQQSAPATQQPNQGFVPLI